MIVFKNYFKIVGRHLGLIIMFSLISIGISIANTTFNETEEFISLKPTLAIINNDDSALSNSFVKYISQRADIEEVGSDEKSIQDALYLNKVDSILIIPNGFVRELLRGKKPDIKIKKSTQNYSEYAYLISNRYFKIAASYAEAGMLEYELINRLEKDMEKEIEVNVLTPEQTNMQKLAIYYSFENYAFLSVFIFIIATIMSIFNRETIKKRNDVSKLNSRIFSNQLFLGHTVLTLSIWAIFIIISVILYKDLMFTTNGLLFIINSLCFVFTATSIAYLVGTLVKNKNVITGVQNVISLGLSFISGCFVAIEFLDPSIIKFAKLFPSYWFIKGNYDIADLSTFNLETLIPIIIHFMIVIMFGVIYFSIAKIVSSKKQK